MQLKGEEIMFLDGVILAKALHPEAAEEIDRIVMRGEILKVAIIGLFFVVATCFAVIN